MSQPTTAIKLNSTTPAPPSGEQNIVFQSDGGTPQQQITAYDPLMVGDTGSGGEAGNVPTPGAGDAAAGKFLKADGSWAVPTGGGGSSDATELQGVSIDSTAPTTGQVLTYDGSEWAPATPSGGGGGGGLWSGLISVPTLASPLNLSNDMNQQGSFATSATSAGISLVDMTGKGSDFVEGVLDSYPTAPFTLTWLTTAVSGGNFNNCGLIVASSLTGAVMMFGFRWGSGGPWEPWVLTYATPNSSPGAPATPAISLSGLVWFQYEDDGTDITFSYSLDGVYWVQIYTVSKASSYLGSSGFAYIGFGLEAYSGVQMSILSLTKS